MSDIRDALEKVGAYGAVEFLDESRPHPGASRPVGCFAMLEWLAKQYPDFRLRHVGTSWVVSAADDIEDVGSELARNPFIDEALVVAVLATNL